jgi:mono/diheme cytochrome c family protein
VDRLIETWPMKIKLLKLVGVLALLARYISLPTVSLADQAAGSKVYLESCAVCHMTDGSGVPGMQPALDGDPLVGGDPGQLIRLILEGPAKVLPANRPVFSSTMPAFNQLSDQQIADLLTYVRDQYGGKASAIKSDQVAVERRNAASGDRSSNGG